MIYEKIDLSGEFIGLTKDKSGNPTLDVYVPNNFEQIDIDRKRPSVIICPGGGYRFLSEKENEPIALAYMGRGFNAFVLNYTVYTDGTYPTQLLEAAAAVAYVRRNADKYHADPEAISVLGFSAGGHLAGSIGTLWKDEIISETLDIECRAARPDAMVLCYAVVSAVNSHAPSVERISAGDPEIMEYLSLDKHIDGDTPPAYIFATSDDGIVNAKGSLTVALAFQEHNVPYELHMYKHGKHGYALGTYVTQHPDRTDKVDPYVAGWFDESVHFLKELFSKNNL